MTPTKINKIALLVVMLLFLSQTVFLILQIFFGAKSNYYQPQPVLSGLFTGFLLVVSLLLFFIWQKQFRYLLLAFFFFWLSFAVKDIAWYVIEEKRVSLEILVTIFRIMMSLSLATGILKGEVTKFSTWQKKETKQKIEFDERE